MTESEVGVEFKGWYDLTRGYRVGNLKRGSESYGGCIREVCCCRVVVVSSEVWKEVN